MALSSEDALRLNVLLANKPKAIRIDESSMILYGLSEKGEAKVSLNPNCRDEQYLRQVRETLSGHVLGSPGGYPIYLQRWTRMGQTRDDNLEQLLLLGEPVAVVAVTCARGLTDELARLAWWAGQQPDNARRMLSNPAVVAGSMGPELANFLIEFLPFENEPEVMVEDLRLALQPGLVSDEMRAKLWKRAEKKPVYYLGFLASTPDDLPEKLPPRADYAACQSELEPLAEAGNCTAQQLLRLLDAPGQGFLMGVARVLKKPANQEVISLLLDVVRNYLSALRAAGDPDLTLEELQLEVETLNEEERACLAVLPEMANELRAMRLLSGLGYGVLRPVFSRSDAIGSLMRRKLEPVLTPLGDYLSCLRSDR
ncbi:hypothetical protein [Candidatus Endoriftia persephonae]|jgi:hypothetical protein|uniref:Sulfite reduction-associated protein DsrS n=2 Tax=Gammaproteobacteria TaxID=1236 RepID=G2FHL3_9GAMM|nr:hypothetical protein [Candidatus Endoriftia persephone]EGW53657.1 sulfite reduction-associated protein DsrS [endosymbiont of Tevnia jerichonana (vent Tica)]USF86875.1 sulfur reduction protein DsrS [Candidatus Endoriftia persephone]